MRKMMNEKLFRAIKIMVEGGATTDEIADYLQISPATIGRVRAAENITEYFNQMAAMHAKSKKAENKPEEETPTQVVEHRQSVTIQATHFMEQNQRKANETLELISRKLTELLEVMQQLNAKWN